MVMYLHGLNSLSHPVMLKFVTPLLLIFAATAGSLAAQDAVSVERVKFDSLSDDWLQIEIQLECNGNPSPDARNKDFVENIVVKPLIGYALGGGEFQFYSAEVEVMIMEVRDKNSVYFYMPGPVVERDKLARQPEYYFVEIIVNGQPQTPKKGPALSSSIKDLTVLQNMQSKAQTQLSENENILQPSYFAPAQYSGRARNLPVFVRREPRQ